MKLFFSMIAFMSVLFVKAQTPTTSQVWINEFHYDGVTTYGSADAGEFIELIISKALFDNAIEFAKLSIVLYTSGALDDAALAAGRGMPYNTASTWYTAGETVHPLNTFTACSSGSSDFMVLNKSIPILQDVPAAIAIVYDNTSVVQLLSYEKQFKIIADSKGGAAAGLTTTLITTAASTPAMENALSLPNHAIALTGTGNSYSQFTWDDNVARTSSACAVNSGQTLMNGTLPVVWLDFKAKAVAGDIYVSWKVGEEANTKKYDIELSGFNTTFKKTTEVIKQTQNNGIYNYTLNSITAGTYLVRIKSVDVDGRFNYSAERKVTIGNKNENIAVYPNPLKGKSGFLQIVPKQKNGYILSVIDATGRIVKQQKLNTLQSNQINILPLNFDKLKVGNYKIRITNAGESYTMSLVLMD